ncbi:MAG: D-alanyl-D-alanine carboxypeptidase family protein [Micrococcales bacterium]
MFQPKRQPLLESPKPKRAGIIPLAHMATITSLLVAVSAPALAETPTPTPTPSPSITAGFDFDSATSAQVVVNKNRPLNPLTYKPVIDKWLPLAIPAAGAYRSLKKGMAAAGAGTLCLNSGYRSFATQTNTYNTDVARYGKKVAENLAAHPGYSEHQTGLAADVSTTALGCRITNFGGTKASNFIAANAYKYGFIVRYPSGQTSYTGYQYEPWHIRFVGIDVATAMHDQKIIVLEKFFGLPAAPSYLN